MIADLVAEPDVKPKVRSRLSADEFIASCAAGAFSEDAHIELVDGELVEMPPEGSGHSFNNVETVAVLREIVRRQRGLEIGANLAVKLSADRVVGPDAVVVDAPEGRPSAIPASAVRLAVEHAWSTRRYDLTEKADLYAAAGVPEYWVLDNVDNVLHRFHSPRAGAYTRDAPLGLDERVAVPFAPGETVRVGDLFRLG